MTLPEMFAHLTELAKPHGLEIVHCDMMGHMQIRGGVLLVNYYPESKKRTAYIQGMSKSFQNVTPEAAINLALRPLPISIRVKRKRRGGIDKRRKLKKRLYAKSNLCYRCGQPMATIEDATFEHIVPLSRGGLDHPNNMSLSHALCNWEAGNAMPTKRNQQ